MKELVIVSNWKMNLSLNQALEFAGSNYDDFVTYAHKKNLTLVLCPSFESLYPITKMFDSTPVAIGAQDCSPFTKGSFTGHVSVESIKDLGCTYTIIGHSERRKYNHENSEKIAKKFFQLLNSYVSPILCVGETRDEYEAGSALRILENQLKPVVSVLEKIVPFNASQILCIAYEPVWSIGTGNVAANDHIETVFTWLTQWAQKIDNRKHFRFLYGGSVNDTNVTTLCKIKELEGFLVGKASLDFTLLKKIISYTFASKF